jgi:hypothetical protein|tara:strand:- start:179 stop:772 length:594 start_codon:yes stop_codon:yes gene_type:complete
MKLKTLPQKLRATVVSSAHNLAVQTTAFKTSVVVSFFKLRTQVGFFLFLRFLQDNISLQSLTTLFLTKPVVDSITVQDVLNAEVGKPITDSGVITDTLVTEQTKPVTDNISLQSLPILSLSKIATDSADIQDVLNQVEVDKPVTDSGTIVDIFIRHVQYTKNFTNNLGLSDTGGIVVQDYCGPDYFAGDYIGIARTF